MRLDKYLVACGQGTRSEVKKMVRQGRVVIDGVVAKSSDQKIDEQKSLILLDGIKQNYREFIYLLMNKPSGYISATYDNHQKTVIDLLPEEYKHFSPFPVGRLDIDTEGLLVFTNDGKLAHELTSPKKQIFKTYYAKLDIPANQEDIEVFKKGIFIEDDVKTLPSVLQILSPPTDVLVSICEGKFHQVKRMVSSVGKNVCYLERVQMGRLSLDKTLKRGEVRELSIDELELLKENDVFLMEKMANWELDKGGEL